MKILKLLILIFTLASVSLLFSCGACEHEYSESTVAATCTEDGLLTRTCSKCGDVNEEVIPAYGHSFKSETVSPDCDSEGYTLNICACGFSYKSEIIAALEHDYELTVTSPSCETHGFTLYFCKNCDLEYEGDVTKPLGHSTSQISIEPDCINQGYTSYYCLRCDYSYVSDYKEPLGHTFSLEVKEPGCESVGFTTYSCENCDFAYDSDFVDPVGHSLSVDSVTAPLCEVEGYTTYICNDCKYSYKSDFTDPLGHSLKKGEVTEPKCESDGYTAYKCENCEYSYFSDFVEPVGHSFSSEEINKVSCTDVGETKYTCSCGVVYTALQPPTGHKFSEEVIPPTVYEMGYTVFRCDCGFEYVGNYRFYSEIFDDAYAGNSQVLARGIDISKWNHKVNPDGSFAPIDWEALKSAGVDYVILKIGSTPRENGSKGGLEPTFEMDYAGAKAAGLDVGVYYFTYSNSVAGILRDAEVVLDWLEGKQFEYPIYLDVEDVPKENYYPSQIASPILTEMCLNFCSVLQKAGYYTGLYVNNEFLFNIMQTENMLKLFDIWYARYPSSESYEWDPEDDTTFVWNTEDYGEHLGMWQYTRLGVLQPIYGDVDFNYSYKDYPSLIKAQRFNGFK